MTPELFAEEEYKNYRIYKELARIETIPDFKNILQELSEHEFLDFNFWLQFSRKKEFYVPTWKMFFVRIMRFVLGLTFTAKFMERKERRIIEQYSKYIETAEEEMKKGLKIILEHEEKHERELIGKIHEDKVKFLGSIVLGLNDGLIELSGALVGFTLAFQNTRLVAAAGSITGIAAALSMTASAYLQAKNEEHGRDAARSSLYTGVSYIIVVSLLVSPFFLFSSLFVAVGIMIFTVISIVFAMAFYTSVVFERNFRVEAQRMLMFSLGVATIAFVIGYIFQKVSGFRA